MNFLSISLDIEWTHWGQVEIHEGQACMVDVTHALLYLQSWWLTYILRIEGEPKYSRYKFWSELGLSKIHEGHAFL